MSVKENIRVKIDRTSPELLWVKGKRIFEYDELNALVLLICFMFKENGRDPTKVDNETLKEYTIKYIGNIIFNYCKYYLLKNNVVLTDEIISSCDNKITLASTSKKFKDFLYSKGDIENFFLTSSIRSISFGENLEPDFIDLLTKEYIQEKLIKKPEISLSSFSSNDNEEKEEKEEEKKEESDELNVGDHVCGFDLIRCVKKDEKSQIWKGKQGKNFFSLKFTIVTLDAKQNKSLNTTEKLIKHFQDEDLNYLGYLKLKDFDNKVKYFRIDYYNRLKMKVQINEWLEGPINNIKIENKKIFLQNLLNVLYNLHLTGMIHNNLKPEHIMKDGDKYILIDYKHITRFKNIDEHQSINVYTSLSLLENNSPVTEYDDIESLFYIFNEITTKIIPEFTSIEDHISNKTNLRSYSEIVKYGITMLREIKEGDSFIKGVEVISSMNDYISGIYKTYIVSIVTNMLSSYTEIADLNLNLNPSTKALLDNVRNMISQDKSFSEIFKDSKKFDDISLKIVNYMTYNCEYPSEDMILINRFLS
jgi:hypothetical protein